MNRKNWARDIWKNKDYFDIWHINHFLAGPVCGGIATFFKIQFWPAFFISAILMLGWEIYEVMSSIKETKFNRIMDILLGIIGFLGWNLSLIYLSSVQSIILFLIILSIWLILEFWGYWAYKKLKKI